MDPLPVYGVYMIFDVCFLARLVMKYMVCLYIIIFHNIALSCFLAPSQPTTVCGGSWGKGSSHSIELAI